MAKAVKLADIGERLGVSTVTVSKALSDQKGVSEEMRAKIKKLAEDMGYQQPSAIRKVKPRKSYNIGVLVADYYLDKYISFYWQMYQAVASRALQKECFSMLEMITSEDESMCTMPKLLMENKADGIIIIGRPDKKYLENLRLNSTVPIVYLDFYEEKQNCDVVISDSFYGSYQLTNYLIRNGHQKIAFVGTVLGSSSITDRYLGYQKALMENGLEQRKEWVIDDRPKEGGKIDNVNLLKIPEKMPTAFVCNCDLTASEMIKKLVAAGYNVPADVSVVGFDNYLYPGLCDVDITTYEVDIKEMAKKAVHALTKRMDNENANPGTYIVEGHMVIKDSVRDITNA